MNQDFGSQLAPLLLRLHEFGLSVHRNNFESAARVLLGRPRPPTVLFLVEELADALCRGYSGDEAALLRKSIQEAVLQIIDVEIDISVLELEERVETFLKDHGSKGLLQTFLGTHLRNVAWFELTEIIAETKATVQDVKKLARDIDEACGRHIQFMTRKWRPWPKMNLLLAEALVDIIREFLFGPHGSIREWERELRSGQSRGTSA